MFNHCLNFPESNTFCGPPPFIAYLYGCSRTKAQEGKPKQVYGALIGKTVGRDIEVMNSFELDYSTVDGLVSSNFKFWFA